MDQGLNIQKASFQPREETPLQGLISDLMDAFGPPVGRKPKLMTGFTEILSMITGAAEDRSLKATSSQQSTVSSEPRIHEIFQQASYQLLESVGKASGPILLEKPSDPGFKCVPPRSAPSSIPRRIGSPSTERITRLHFSPKVLTDSSISMTHPPSRIPIKQDTSSLPNVRPQIAERGLIGPTPSCKNGFVRGEVRSSHNPQNSLSRDDKKGPLNPKSVDEVETFLLRRGYIPSGKTKTAFPLKHPAGLSEKSPMSIGSQPVVAQILDSFAEVAGLCCEEIVSGGVCRHCSRVFVNETCSKGAESVFSELSLDVDEKKSDYHDCYLGAESGDKGLLWSSADESED